MTIVNILTIWWLIGGIILLVAFWTVFGSVAVTDLRLKDFIETVILSIIMCMAAGVLWPFILRELIKDISND